MEELNEHLKLVRYKIDYYQKVIEEQELVIQS